jgi:hypothetical protein
MVMVEFYCSNRLREKWVIQGVDNSGQHDPNRDEPRDWMQCLAVDGLDAELVRVRGM